MSAEMGYDATESVDTLVHNAVDAISALIGAPYTKVYNADLPALGQQLETASRLLRAAQIEFVDDVDQRGLAASLSCTSTRVLLTQMLDITSYEAGTRVRTAKAIYAQDLPSGGETPARLPVLAAAVGAGLIDPDHADTVIATMKHLPATMTTTHATTPNKRSYRTRCRWLLISFARSPTDSQKPSTPTGPGPMTGNRCPKWSSISVFGALSPV